jgi:hypothetical protein
VRKAKRIRATLLAVLATLTVAAVPAGAHRGCHTNACDTRQAVKHKRMVVAPYASWLRRLRACESSGNPRAISPGGTYRGWYQFDRSTWRSVGGRGDPVRASRLEQSYRAVLLRQRRGIAPWPVCGRR